MGRRYVGCTVRLIGRGDQSFPPGVGGRRQHVLQRDRDQEIDEVGEVAEVAARPLLDAAQPVLGGVVVDLEPLRGGAQVQVGGGERPDRRGQDPAAHPVLLQQLHDPRVTRCRAVSSARSAMYSNGEIRGSAATPPSSGRYSRTLLASW